MPDLSDEEREQLYREKAASRLFSGRVDGNIIVGSIALYLLLALSWACLYLLVLEFYPGSFNGIEEQAWSENMAVATYFSFVTLMSPYPSRKSS